MVAFVPNSPDAQAPSYLGLSRPLSPFDVQMDRTGATAITGVGEVLKDVVGGADNTIKSVIDSKLQPSVDAVREGFTNSLEGVAGVPQDKRVADTSQPLNILTGATSAPVPAAVDQGLNTANSLVAASTTGKLNPTYYEGRLDMIAKDLRNQFPGYRDYIDTEIAKMTGGNPANQYISSLLTQINQGITRNQSETDKAIEFLGHKEVQDMPGLSQVLQDVATGKAGGNPLAYAIQKTSDWRATLAKWDRNAAERADWKGTNDQLITKAGQDLTTFGNDIVNQAHVNLFGNDITFKKFQDTISDLGSGRIQPLNAEQGLQLQQSAHSLYDSLYSQLKQKAFETPTAGGKSIASILGPDQLDQQITKTLSGLKVTIDAIDNEKYGVAHYTTLNNTAIAANSTSNFLNNTNTSVASTARNIAGLDKLSPQSGLATFMKDAVTDPKFVEGLGALITNQKAEIATQQAERGAKSTLTIFDALKQTESNRNDDPKNPNPTTTKAVQAARQSVISMPAQAVSDPKLSPQVVKNVFAGAYGASNIGVVGLFAPDQISPDGKLIKGQHAVFNQMLLPTITNKAWEMGQQDPAVWNNYKLWAEKTHAQLFTQDIHDLNTIASNPNIKLSYDSDKHEFGFSTVHTPGPGNAAVPFYSDAYGLKIAGINSSMKAMAAIAQKEGRDPNAYLLNLMTGMGLDPNQNNQAGALMRSVISSQKRSDATYPELEGMKSADSGAPTQLHELVKTGESGGNYDALYGTNSKIPLSNMTIGEVMAVQKHYTDQGSPSSAAGAYQFLRPTLASLVKSGVVSLNDKFDQDTQDKLATALMERRGLNDFKSGKMPKEQFVNNLAKEWAALPTTKGQSFYEGDGLNHARVRLPQVFASLAGL